MLTCFLFKKFKEKNGESGFLLKAARLSSTCVEKKLSL